MIPIFNALECAERLTAAEVPPNQAKAFAKEYSNMASSLMDKLATKADLNALEDRTKAQLINLEDRIDARFVNLETRLDARFEKLEDKIDRNDKRSEDRLNTAMLKLQLTLGGMLFTSISLALGVLRFMF